MTSALPIFPSEMIGTARTVRPGYGEDLRYYFQLIHDARRGRKRDSCLACWNVTKLVLNPEQIEEYQIAIEMPFRGSPVFHCTCADFCFRHGQAKDYACKHIRMLNDELKAYFRGDKDASTPIVLDHPVAIPNI